MQRRARGHIPCESCGQSPCYFSIVTVITDQICTLSCWGSSATTASMSSSESKTLAARMCFCYNTRQSARRTLHLELLGVLRHDGEHVLLGVEHARRAPELQPLLARDLGDRPLRRQVAVQDLRNTM